MPEGRCQVEWRPRILSSACVRVGPALEQHLHHRVVSLSCCFVERRPPPLTVYFVDPIPGREQTTHTTDIAGRSCAIERRVTKGRAAHDAQEERHRKPPHHQ